MECDGWIRGFVGGLRQPRRRSYGIAGSAGSRSKAIGRAFVKPSSSIYFQLSPYGGIRPASRRRSRLAPTLAEREEISRGIAVHQSARSMAGLLGRAPLTVSREISRNGGYDGYRATLADDEAWARALGAATQRREFSSNLASGAASSAGAETSHEEN